MNGLLKALPAVLGIPQFLLVFLKVVEIDWRAMLFIVLESKEDPFAGQ